jgi:hypothetical protein
VYTQAYVLHVDYAEMPAGGGGAAYFLGYADPGGPGTLNGGTNPFGIRAACDNSNVAGVDAGCDAGAGTGATRGVELAIPLAAIGSPTGCVKVLALFYSEIQLQFANQTLGPLPAGVCTLGPTASAIDFRTFAGDQYFTLCPGVPVRTTTWGSLKSAYR